MRTFIFAIIILIPLFAKSQSSKTPLVDIYIATTVIPAEDLKDHIKIDPYQIEEDKIYYYFEEFTTILIKGVNDGSATFIMPYSENILKGILNEFILSNFEIENSEDKIIILNSKLGYYIYKQEDKLIIFGMEHGKVPK
jgi:hypothetical protein